VAALTVSASLHGQTLNTLFTFGNAKLGSQPEDGVAIGANGELFGITFRGGTSNLGVAYELAPPSSSGDPWTVSAIHEFTTLEGNPGAGLMFEPSGVLYGVASGYNTGLDGTVFEFRPPAASGARWREATLYTFSGAPADGQIPQGAPVFGPDHALYGTTYSGGDKDDGTAYRLAPPETKGGAWTEEVLWSFPGYSGDGQGPVGTLTLGADGAIFGVTQYGGLGGGTVFELTPPTTSGGSWTETLLYEFPLQGGFSGSAYPTGVILGPNGVLYGTTGQYDGRVCDSGKNPCGTVFQLVPPETPGGAWTETTIHTFFFGAGDGDAPYAPPLLGSDGVLYGTTGGGGATGHGTIFKMLPPSLLGGSWTEVILYSFTGGADGWLPTNIAFGPDGRLYGTTSLVTSPRGRVYSQGTVFQFVLQ
jgi:uncharacterized repeat protein (TIGR03803 family)